MEAFYHKKLGMINNTPENRKLLIKLGFIKVKKDDTTKEKPVEQDSGNTKRTKKRPTS